MSSRPKIGTVLKEQYEIAQVFGSGRDQATYLATDLFSLERVIVWESLRGVGRVRAVGYRGLHAACTHPNFPAF